MKTNIILSTLVLGLFLMSSIASVNARISIVSTERESAGLIEEDSVEPRVPFADIYVDDDNTEGPWDGTSEHPYRYIQDGIDNASSDDIVYVYNGTYYENIIVNQSINLVGQNKDTTIINGGGNEDVVSITKSSVTISGFTIENSGDTWFDHGITVWDRNPHVENICISDCIVRHNSGGIRFNNVSDGSIINCYIHNNTACSITVYLDSEDILIKNCKIANNGDDVLDGCIAIDGILFDGCLCSNIRITGCSIFSSSWVGIHVYLAKNVEIYNNNIHGNNVCGIVVSGAGDSCFDIAIHNNTIAENGNRQIFFSGGILIQGCSNSATIKHNNVVSNRENGIFLLYASGNIIFENNVINNDNGISLEGELTADNKILISSNNKIIGNNITNNDCGIRLNVLSISNLIYHNNFVINSENANDAGINIWYKVSLQGSKGNYWDDYTGTDNDGDGIGDTPYNIPPYPFPNKDRFPLMSPYNGSFDSDGTICDKVEKVVSLNINELGVASRSTGSSGVVSN